MSLTLKDLIRGVRACKTAAQIRELIATESAKIRTFFRNEDTKYRPRNVIKALYMHMIGFPSSFAQLECLKLIATESFICKKIGYLGLSMLLEEESDILVLATNVMRNDLISGNSLFISLALTALGNLATEDMARDLAPEVEKLIHHKDAFIRKKSILTAGRIIRKVPDTLDRFIGCVRNLLTDKSHAVVLATLSLMKSMIEVDPETIEKFKKFTKGLCKILQTLSETAHSPEYNVAGIVDPYLQISILQLLQIFGKDDKEKTQLMTDILAKIANSVQSSNVGNAVLYETVMTILLIESEKRSQLMAISILSKFLSKNSNNLRYVALNTLSRVVDKVPNAIQRQRKTIVNCLHDSDISIRRRALDLVFSLVNQKNAKTLIKELMNYMLESNQELRNDLTSKICLAIEKLNGDKQWQLETLIEVLEVAGQYVSEEIAAKTINLIIEYSELQSFVVHKFFSLLNVERDRPQKLIQVAVWCIGEFGDLLTEEIEHFEAIPSEQVVDLLEFLLVNTNVEYIKYYLITSLIKLTTRFPDQAPKIQDIFSRYRTNVDIEIQQRSCEFYEFFKYGDFSISVLDKIPPISALLDESNETETDSQTDSQTESQSEVIKEDQKSSKLQQKKLVQEPKKSKKQQQKSKQQNQNQNQKSKNSRKRK
ncbi:ap-1 complex subunit gamma [Anaeramoeba ignava]|uniref:AP-1 complex subunit gamma n=1 Tax=Anaeramoeba ignava TaxID=1746090 RepID=A0A9Q0LNS5_ANAIG|nr:ap-1 complex subunit gamma [Anaeramoeba ignava]